MKLQKLFETLLKLRKLFGTPPELQELLGTQSKLQKVAGAQLREGAVFRVLKEDLLVVLQGEVMQLKTSSWRRRPVQGDKNARVFETL